ncbi:MAG: hypothetical protein WCC17_15585 [Candidatus Nitrosopolaris sp.]|jgi:hypothetical protein
MNKNTSVTMAAAIAGILTLAVMTVGLHQAFADGNQKCCDDKNQKNEQTTKVAVGGNGGSGGAGGAGGEGGAGGANVVKDTKKANVDQDANGGGANGGHGGNSNGGNANA